MKKNQRVRCKKPFAIWLRVSGWKFNVSDWHLKKNGLSNNQTLSKPPPWKIMYSVSLLYSCSVIKYLRRKTVAFMEARNSSCRIWGKWLHRRSWNTEGLLSKNEQPIATNFLVFYFFFYIKRPENLRGEVNVSAESRKTNFFVELFSWSKDVPNNTEYWCYTDSG